MVEIGPYQGESTEMFLQLATELHAVDPWRNGYDPNDPASETVDGDIVQAAFDARFSRHPRVKKLRMSSLAASTLFDDGSLDLVYIDGDHRPQAIIEDLRHWKPKVKPGGIMAGHDYWPGQFDQVVTAVNAMFGKPDRVFEDMTWMCRM